MISPSSCINVLSLANMNVLWCPDSAKVRNLSLSLGGIGGIAVAYVEVEMLKVVVLEAVEVRANVVGGRTVEENSVFRNFSFQHR